MVTKKVTAFDVVLVILMILLSAIFIYPLLNMLALSFSDSQELKSLPVYLMPKGFSLESYKALLNDSRTILYYWNTIQYAAVGTVIMLLTTSLMAYPLSIPSMRGRKLVSILLVVSKFSTPAEASRNADSASWICLLMDLILRVKLSLFNDSDTTRSRGVSLMPAHPAFNLPRLFSDFFVKQPNSMLTSARISAILQAEWNSPERMCRCAVYQT